MTFPLYPSFFRKRSTCGGIRNGHESWGGEVSRIRGAERAVGGEIGRTAPRFGGWIGCLSDVSPFFNFFLAD